MYAFFQHQGAYHLQLGSHFEILRAPHPFVEDMCIGGINVDAALLGVELID